ncbi:PAAR domain-containing protein [Enterobacter soli]|nr:PAAR domain-containing protein [Enterobacter soli]
MARGYFLTVGCQTTCGGSIITGYAHHTLSGQPTARNGDKYICGVDKQVHTILGGIPFYSIDGVAAAGTLHSRGSCDCKCEFIPSDYSMSYGDDEPVSRTQRLQSSIPTPIAPKPVSAPTFSPQPPAATPPKPISPVPVKEEEQREPVDAGYCILPYGSHTRAYDPHLFLNPPSGVRELYLSLNGEDKQYKVGSILLIVDPEKQDEKQIAHLQAAKERIDTALAPLSHQQAQFLFKNKDTLEMFAAAASKTSEIYGYSGQVTEAAKGYFQQVENILVSIEKSYQNHYITSGALISEQFYVERRQLLGQLDSVLKMFSKHRFMFNEYTDLKKSLGLSTHAITHRWNETGVNDIEGYATHIEKLAKYVKMMETAGKIGVGLAALDTAAKITEACATGRECAKTSFTSIGEFSGSMLGGFIAAKAVEKGAASVVCSLILGAATIEAGGAGALLCTLGVAGGIAYGSDKTLNPALGKIGEWSGEKLGLYEINSDD